MSDRAAKLLLEIAGYVKLEADHGSFRRLGAEVSIHPRLAEEILQWSRGYKEHLLHVMERKEGVRLAKARAEAARDEMRDEEALARVREMAARKDADDFACVMAAEALKLMEGDHT